MKKTENKLNPKRILPRSWRHMAIHYNEDKKKECMQDLFNIIADSCRGEVAFDKDHIQSAQTLLNYVMSEKDFQTYADIELHDVQTLEEINQCSTKIIQLVLRGDLPVSFAEKFSNLLIRKANFIHSGGLSKELKDLQTLVLENAV